MLNVGEDELFVDLVFVITLERSEELPFLDKRYFSPGVGVFSTVVAAVRLLGLDPVLLEPNCLLLLVATLLLRRDFPCWAAIASIKEEVGIDMECGEVWGEGIIP